MRSLFAGRRWQLARRKSRQQFRCLRVEPLEGRFAPAILTVNSSNDGPVNLTDATVTLRDAIDAANRDVADSPGGPAGSGADEIRFQAGLTGVIVVNQGQLKVQSDLTITGPGASLLTITGNGDSEVFNIDDGQDLVSRIVVFTGLNIAGGSTARAISNAEDLTVQSCTMSGHTSDRGGGILNQALGTMMVLNSTIGGSSAGSDGAGGGIFNQGNATVQNSAISGNTAKDGGGIENASSALLTVQSSTISGNSASNDAGGVYNRGTLLVQNSTISGNSSAVFPGGGVHNFDTATVQNSTLSGNSAGFGGGISSENFATLTVQNSTITQNHCGSDGDGGGLVTTNGKDIFDNTIVAGNFKGSGTTTPNDLDNRVALDPSSANNLIGTGGTGGLTNGTNGNQVGVADAKLGPLADNGGPTKTHALLVGSPGIDKGNNAKVPGSSSNDQRGASFVRVFGGTVDIGAYEAQPETVVVDTNADEDDGDTSPGHRSLREALDRTNNNPSADTITFDPTFFSVPRTISLGLGELPVRDDLTLTGPGANRLTINGNKASGIFDVDDQTSSVKTVTISGLTITGGNAGSSSGGGILNREDLTLLNSALLDNLAHNGAGLVNFGTVKVLSSTLSGNSASSYGGGIDNEGTATVQSSTLSANLADFAGGIYNSGPLTILNSTLSGNLVSEGGGGLYTLTGTTTAVTIRDSTITQNHTDNTDSNGSQGGGIYVSFGPVTLYNAIVASNFRGSGTTTEDDINGTLVAASASNLIGTGGAGGLTNGTNGNQVGVADPKLGPLADNGGPTKTHALLSGSPAIDKGSNAQVPAGLTTDQRGGSFTRIVNNIVDVGALESQPTFPWHNFGTLMDDVAGSGSPTPDGSVDANDALTIINYINAHGSGPIPANAEVGLPYGFLDADIAQGSGNQIVAGDVLHVINYINAGRPLGGEAAAEGEAPPSQSGINSQSQNPDSLSADLLFLLANDISIHSAPRRVLR